MLEYLFFNTVYAEKFSRFLGSKTLEYQSQIEPMQNATVITTSEDISDKLWDEVDEYYDVLSEQDQQLLQQSLQDEDKQDAAGIYIQLKNNRQTIAKVDPKVMNRMLELISMDELNGFIEAVVTSVENPDEGPLCDKPTTTDN